MGIVPIVSSSYYVGLLSTHTHMCSIWCSALVEAVVLGVLVIWTLVLGLVLSMGLASTCDTLRDINKEENE